MNGPFALRPQHCKPEAKTMIEDITHLARALALLLLVVVLTAVLVSAGVIDGDLVGSLFNDGPMNLAPEGDSAE